MKNRISIEISGEAKTKVTESLNGIEEAIGGQLISLTNKDRVQLPKMSDGTIPFVEKVISYAKSSPEFLPPYVDVVEMDNDFTLVEALTDVLREVKQLHDNLEDTITLAGSEAYTAALSYYNSVKMAAKLEVPGAKSIQSDLSKRFAKAGSSEGSESSDDTETTEVTD